MRLGGGIEKSYSNPQEWIELVKNLDTVQCMHRLIVRQIQ